MKSKIAQDIRQLSDGTMSYLIARRDTRSISRARHRLARFVEDADAQSSTGVPAFTTWQEAWKAFSQQTTVAQMIRELNDEETRL